MKELKFPDGFLWVESKLLYFQRVLQKIVPNFLIPKPRAFVVSTKECLNFPKNFLWGSSTSAYQVEGGIGPVRSLAHDKVASPEDLGEATSNGVENDWSEAARQGKVPFAGRACDSYNRYEEDFDIAKSLGQNAHRFSIEWARVEPEEGKFDEQAIDHYRKVLQALRDRGLEPVVTLYHWTLPLWFVKKGSWLAKDSHQTFGSFVERVVSEYKDLVKFWITLNEPMVYASGGFLRGNWPPFVRSPVVFLRVISRLTTSHDVAYDKIKSISATAQVGIAKHNINFESNANPIYQLAAKFMIWFWNHRFLRKIAKKQDFLGLNYYFHRKFGDSTIHEKSDLNWDIYPAGIRNLLLELQQYNKPIYIFENGLADAKDEKRAKFIRDHLTWVHRAIQEGIDVRGYFYWSLLDNFEWAHGFGPRFGLVEMNYATMERHIRLSAYEYKKICESNAILT